MYNSIGEFFHCNIGSCDYLMAKAWPPLKERLFQSIDKKCLEKHRKEVEENCVPDVIRMIDNGTMPSQFAHSPSSPAGSAIGARVETISTSAFSQFQQCVLVEYPLYPSSTDPTEPTYVLLITIQIWSKKGSAVLQGSVLDMILEPASAAMFNATVRASP